MYTPIPTSVTFKSLTRASVVIKGDEAHSRHVYSLYCKLIDEMHPLGRLLGRPEALHIRQNSGKHLMMPVLATKLAGFFCTGVLHIVHIEVDKLPVLNWGLFEIEYVQAQETI